MDKKNRLGIKCASLSLSIFLSFPPTLFSCKIVLLINIHEVYPGDVTKVIFMRGRMF